MSDRFADLPDPAAEVRRCGACGVPAMVAEQVWRHSRYGQSMPGVTRQCRCQSCGARLTLHNREQIRSLRVAAWFLVWLILPTPIMLARARRWEEAWDRNPLVPGAAMPARQQVEGTAERRCAQCGNTARLVKLVKRRINGMPSGTQSTYRCASCEAVFSIESLGGQAGRLASALLFAGGGVLAIIKSGNDRMGRYLWGPLALAGGIYVLWIFARSVRTALRNPRVR